MEAEISKYAGIVIAVIASAITYYVAFRNDRAKELRLATRDAITAQASHIMILESQLKDAMEQLKEKEETIVLLRGKISLLETDKFNLMQTIWHLEHPE